MPFIAFIRIQFKLFFDNNYNSNKDETKRTKQVLLSMFATYYSLVFDTYCEEPGVTCGLIGRISHDITLIIGVLRVIGVCDVFFQRVICFQFFTAKWFRFFATRFINLLLLFWRALKGNHNKRLIA